MRYGCHMSVVIPWPAPRRAATAIRRPTSLPADRGSCARARAPGRSTSPGSRRLVDACRADRQWLTAEAHDRAVAAISHLPLALAVALVDSVSGADDWPVAEGLAAGGWRSATRLAQGDPTMGAGIAATNATELARRLRSIRTQLDDWLVDLEATPDDLTATANRIQLRLSAARRTLTGAE